jgi:hypothetical protein
VLEVGIDGQVGEYCHSHQQVEQVASHQGEPGHGLCKGEDSQVELYEV